MAAFQRPGQRAPSAFGISFATDRDSPAFGSADAQHTSAQSQVAPLPLAPICCQGPIMPCVPAIVFPTGDLATPSRRG